MCDERNHDAFIPPDLVERVDYALALGHYPANFGLIYAAPARGCSMEGELIRWRSDPELQPKIEGTLARLDELEVATDQARKDSPIGYVRKKTNVRVLDQEHLDDHGVEETRWRRLRAWMYVGRGLEEPEIIY